MFQSEFQLSSNQEHRTLTIRPQNFININDVEQESGVYEILESGFPLGDIVIKNDGDDYDYTGDVLMPEEVSQVVEFILEQTEK